MISVPEAFTKFKSRLEITPSEQDKASSRHQTLREQIRDGFAIDHDFLTGSYARHTKTKPLKDIDVLFVLSEEERGYLDKPPNDILDAFHRQLEKHYPSHRVTTERHSVRVDFGVQIIDDTSDDVTSIDSVPAFSTGEHYVIPDEFTNGWTHTDPRVHAELATAANEALDQHWKPLVKMAKKWNDYHDKPVKPSFLLEVIALECLRAP